jgi:hypothetical protein
MTGATVDDQSAGPVDRRRHEILAEISEISTMRRGSFNEFYYDQKLKDGAKARRGPYYNLTTKDDGGKTRTIAVPKDNLDKVRREVDSYRRFKELSDEYIDVCEALADTTGWSAGPEQ